MVKRNRYGPALTMVMRACGVHHVHSTITTIAANASLDAAAPPGARIGSAATCSGDNFLRMATCEASAMHHASIPPTSEAPMIYRKAFCGATYCRTKATTIPDADNSTALRGEPCADSCASLAGAYPDSASEYNMREVTYRAAFAPESAAVSTTKFITSEMAAPPPTSHPPTTALR